MTLAVIAEPAPLATNADGVVCVGGTRVTLDTIVAVFQQGASAEEIAHRYPVLRLGDIYAVIAFYLNHHDEVAVYLQERQQQAQRVRQSNQQRFDPEGLRDRLLARRNPSA
ncbi:MAG: DUF433 domain-containing protein [Spirulinaceae cyanobacterium RM2_2_10]|nr:DUF433 domain-containing protein [Spirulinaceae cyanobacterium SM2_1_0]NJO20812.1 DUF433 domain-containing protein [Spirulinaceae cyanobacterium RM2_2_10]